MNFSETENQKAIRATVRDFAKSEILPHRMDWDERQYFPRELFHKMGELGLLGMLVPEEFGGAGMGYMEYKVAIEELAKVCGSIGLSMAAHNSLCTNHILMFGSDEQKKRFLPALASGRAHRSLGTYRGEYRERCHADAMHRFKRHWSAMDGF